ncbi:S41 family peptidase [Candidatus Peregrinibacteria bacterium]|nr:S41 family peptidase [Candidatus Peregrinibacteria bacterium]
MKKLFASVLLSVLLISNYGNAYAYDDIPNDSEYFYAIEYLRRNDVFQDTKNFNPDIIISKAEFIKYLVLLNSPKYSPVENVKLPYEDTSDNGWYAPYFAEAIKLGIISDRELKMEPYKKLTLIDALQLVFQSQSIPIPKVYKGDIPYLDAKRNETFAPLIMRALSFGLIEPQKTDYVGMYRRVTRAEAARIIYKMDLVNLTPASKPEAESFDLYLQKIISSWEIINSGYINRDDISQSELSDAAISAMVDVLNDPYSAYLDPAQNSAFSDDLDGEIEGIGAFIGINENNQIAIIAPIKNSPAEIAGILPGDIITKVDGVDLTDKTLYEAVNLIKGPRGSTVKLTIKRNGGNKVVEVVRDVITIDSMDYETISNNQIMYVDLDQFNQNAPSEFGDIVDIIQNSREIKGLIIDVRDNPGGLLDSAIGILNYLLKPGAESVTIQYNYFKYAQFSTGKGELSDFPIVILVNENSASASEILAGALQDFGLAKVIGVRSFGKGSVQEVNYFIDNSSLKLTVAKWLTPLKQDIEENGIVPDIKVVDVASTKTDEQLERAIVELKKMF